MQARILSVPLLLCSLVARGADRDVVKPEGESIAESLKQLANINMFRAPTREFFGVKEWIPLPADLDRDDLQAIMNSLPFPRIFEYLSETNKTAASEIVNRELSAAITEYLSLYDAEILRTSPHFTLDKLADQKAFSGPVFVEGVPEGKVVIRGARFRVLTLVWTSGMLGLTGTKDQVERAVRLSVKQRTALYDDPTLHPFYKREMLRLASLYNRQILSTGLLGAVLDDASQSSVLKAADAEWQERRLDYSGRSLVLRIASPMNDAHFEILLEKSHLAQPPRDQKK